MERNTTRATDRLRQVATELSGAEGVSFKFERGQLIDGCVPSRAIKLKAERAAQQPGITRISNLARIYTACEPTGCACRKAGPSVWPASPVHPNDQPGRPSIDGRDHRELVHESCGGVLTRTTGDGLLVTTCDRCLLTEVLVVMWWGSWLDQNLEVNSRKGEE
jgi:hypothetical protein